MRSLFWLAAGCVAVVLLMIMAKPLLGVPSRKSGRWALVLGLTLLVVAGCAERPQRAALRPHGPVSTCGAGWGDCSGPAVDQA